MKTYLLQFILYLHMKIMFIMCLSENGNSTILHVFMVKIQKIFRFET